jgi:hypothetical protein
MACSQQSQARRTGWCFRITLIPPTSIPAPTEPYVLVTVVRDLNTHSYVCVYTVLTQPATPTDRV